MNILFIDDVKSPKKWLDEHNSITIVNNYYDAIENIQKQNFDLVDIKLDLPGVNNGYDIVRFISNNNIQIDNIYLHSGDAEGRSKIIKILKDSTTATIQYY